MNEKQATVRIASYCSKAERCEYDVRKKLIAWELDSDTIGRIISYLKKENFLNEERFCQSFIRDKVRFNKWGKNKIIFELKKKHISESFVDVSFRALAIDDEFEEPLMKILESKMRSVKASNDYEKRMKLMRFAAGRGYPADLVRKCLDQLIKGAEDDEFVF